MINGSRLENRNRDWKYSNRSWTLPHGFGLFNANVIKDGATGKVLSLKTDKHMVGTDVILEDIQEDSQQNTKWILYRIEEGWFTISLQTDNNENQIYLTANTNMRLTIEGNRERLNVLKRNNMKSGNLVLLISKQFHKYKLWS